MTLVAELAGPRWRMWGLFSQRKRAPQPYGAFVCSEHTSPLKNFRG